MKQSKSMKDTVRRSKLNKSCLLAKTCIVKMAEVEIKLGLEESEYRTIIDDLKDAMADELDQWNIFFDTKELTGRRNGMTIRLRQVKSLHADPKWYFTVKGGGTFIKGVATRPETECEISVDLAQKIMETPSQLFNNVPKIIQAELEHCKEARFSIVGDMRTIRRVIPYHGMVLECDEMMLPNGDRFYEIEIENDDPEASMKKIKDKLASLNIEVRPSPSGKIGRLMRLPSDKRFSMVFSEK